MAVKSVEVKDEFYEQLLTKLDKYEQLVWFARSHPPADVNYWKTISPTIKEGALNSQSRVEEMFPDEVDQLKCPECSDWNHGFNSGMLAGLRYVLTAAEDPAQAEELFPELYT